MEFQPIEDSISIIVPVYNSSDILPELVRRLREAMWLKKYEFILVDDHSADSSWEKIKELCAKNNNTKGVRLKKNSGQWVAALAGLSVSKGKYLITIDDDLEYFPEDIKSLYDLLQIKSHKVVFGIAPNKYVQQGKNTFLSGWRKKILNIYWATAVTDSFKIIDRNVLFEEDKFLPKILVEAFLSIKVNVAHWGYVKVRFSQRYAGTSNYPLMKKIRLFFIYTLHYGFRPITTTMVFMLMLGVLFGFILPEKYDSIILGVYVVFVLLGWLYFLWREIKRKVPYTISESINL